MRASSLATRLFLSATAWVVVILLLTGIVLSSVYRNATERAFDRRLNLYLPQAEATDATAVLHRQLPGIPEVRLLRRGAEQ